MTVFELNSQLGVGEGSVEQSLNSSLLCRQHTAGCSSFCAQGTWRHETYPNTGGQPLQKRSRRYSTIRTSLVRLPPHKIFPLYVNKLVWLIDWHCWGYHQLTCLSVSTTTTTKSWGNNRKSFKDTWAVNNEMKTVFTWLVNSVLQFWTRQRAKISIYQKPSWTENACRYMHAISDERIKCVPLWCVSFRSMLIILSYS